MGHQVSKSSRTSWAVASVSKGEPGRQEYPRVKEYTRGTVHLRAVGGMVPSESETSGTQIQS